MHKDLFLPLPLGRLFYIGLHWFNGPRQLVFFSSAITLTPNPSLSPSVFISPNVNVSFDVSLVNSTQSDPSLGNSVGFPANSLSPSSPPPLALERFGIVNENGTMMDNFEIRSYDLNVIENWGNKRRVRESLVRGDGDRGRVRVKRFEMCPESLREYIPNMDNVEAITRLKST